MFSWFSSKKEKQSQTLDECSQIELERLAKERGLSLGKGKEKLIQEILKFEKKNEKMSLSFDVYCSQCNKKCLVRFQCSECEKEFCLCAVCHSKKIHTQHHMYREV